jgi:hypothetical protein
MSVYWRWDFSIFEMPLEHKPKIYKLYMLFCMYILYWNYKNIYKQLLKLLLMWCVLPTRNSLWTIDKIGNNDNFIFKVQIWSVLDIIFGCNLVFFYWKKLVLEIVYCWWNKIDVRFWWYFTRSSKTLAKLQLLKLLLMWCVLPTRNSLWTIDKIGNNDNFIFWKREITLAKPC